MPGERKEAGLCRAAPWLCQPGDVCRNSFVHHGLCALPAEGMNAHGCRVQLPSSEGFGAALLCVGGCWGLGFRLGHEGRKPIVLAPIVHWDNL